MMFALALCGFSLLVGLSAAMHILAAWLEAL